MNLWTQFLCEFCYVEQPLKILEQIHQAVSEMKYCNYQKLNFFEKWL